MSFFSNLQMYGRFAAGLPGFLRRRVSLDEARESIRKGLVEREANFVRIVRRGVFDNPRSPYRPLLDLAKWKLVDIEHSVRTAGLEPTLEELRSAGVYFTFEEYKGRSPVVRDGKVIPIRASDFDNPLVSRAYQATTGGLTGAGTRVAMDLDTMAAQVPHLLVGRTANGMHDGPMAIWRGPLPDPTGIGIILRAVGYERVPVRWFTPFDRSNFRPSLKDRMANSSIIAICRLCGVPCPRPEPAPIDQAGIVARWASSAVKEHGKCTIGTSVSLSVRVCLAAIQEGIGLDGVMFMAGGEPFTPARSRIVSQSGAKLVPHYITVDAGPVGMSCADPFAADDLHFFSDCLGLIQHPRTIPHSDVTVNAFYFTSLFPSASKILLNVESDDHGIVEERDCGCPLGEIGYKRHLRQIRSFGKLTGEGVTLVGSEMVRILEEVLPARFGGTPFDFQLLEEEDEHGLGRLTLIVSPRLSIERDDMVVSAVLEALGRSSTSANIARAFWQQAGTLRVRRAEPVWTGRGKFLPIRVRGRSLTGGARDKDSSDAPSRPVGASSSR